jgi:EmrB/QacA subfamily drug resistance transporter
MSKINPPHGRARSWRTSPTVLLAVILTAQLMVVLDATIVNVALPHIQASLGFSSAALSWVLNAYVLTFGGLLLLGARAGDLLGRRRTFLAGITIFSASSLIGGFAVTGGMLLAARAVQGVGGALAAPAALALLTSSFPEGEERVRAIGLFTTVSAAGGALGLVAGGLLTQWASWRWVMFVNVPIGLAVMLAGAVVLAESGRRRGHFDVAGAVTSTAGMTAVVLGLVEAGSVGWSAPITVVSLTLGAALLAGFVGRERVAEEPILPLRVLADPTRAAANAARGLGYAGMYGMVFFLTQFLQDVQHHSALVTGIGFLPTPASVFLSSQLVSRVLVRRLPAKVLMLAGSVLSALGLGLLTQLHPATPYLQVCASLVLIGAGMGTSFVSLTTAALHGVGPSDAGAASGLINVVQQIGGALGLALLVTVFDTVTHGAAVSGGPHLAATVTHGFDVTMAAAGGLAVVALAVVAGFVPWSVGRSAPPLQAAADVDVAAAA